MGFIDRLWEHQTCIKSADAVKKIGRLGRFTAVLQLFCGQDKQLLGMPQEGTTQLGMPQEGMKPTRALLD